MLGRSQRAANYSFRRGSVRACGQNLAACAGLGLARACGRCARPGFRPAARRLGNVGSRELG
eukprot:15474145-Alexandrium_andersonii.AAC.1